MFSLYGFPAPWKDSATFLAALQCMTTPARIVLCGEFWADTNLLDIGISHAGNNPVSIGNVEFVIVPEYLDLPALAALAHGSRCAVLPYKDHPSFPGSGVIPDYLANGVPIIATDVANMRELIGDAGIVVPPGDPAALAAALDAVAGDPATAQRLEQGAVARAPLFSAAHHAQRNLEVYHAVLQRHG